MEFNMKLYQLYWAQDKGQRCAIVNMAMEGSDQFKE
jgi:hypothetical protein